MTHIKTDLFLQGLSRKCLGEIPGLLYSLDCKHQAIRLQHQAPASGSSLQLCFLGMYSKTGRELEEGAAPSRRLNRNLADLYGTGQVPGERLQSVLDDVAACEQQGNIQGFSSLKSSGSTAKNLARDLKRRLMKESIWPAP